MLKVGYWLTMPIPLDPRRDAVTREIDLLQSKYGGVLHSLYPLSRYRRWLPPRWSGVGRARALAAIDREVDLHHVFGPGSQLPGALARLKKPVLYSVTDRVSNLGRPRGSLVAATVGDHGDRDRMLAVGWPVVETVPAGLALARFPRHRPLALEGDAPMTLLAGSAPWNESQFQTKGFDALLAAAAADSRLRLVLLWRGVLEDAIERRIQALGLGDRVEVVRAEIDVSERLDRCHAAVVLAASERVVRPYPHSLLEAISSGRPVLVSACLAISDLVASAGAGVVVEDLSASSLSSSIERLRRGYGDLQSAARGLDLRPFDAETYLSRFDRLYRELASVATG